MIISMDATKGHPLIVTICPPLAGDVPCFYEPVWCKDPPTVKNAQVFTNFSHRGQYLLPTTAEYSCVEGFKLHGDTGLSNV